MSFVKSDGGKVRFSLIPWDALMGIVEVLEFGAARYGADNWLQGADWSRYYNALMRHITAWWLGEKRDPDTGRSHLLHVGACVLFLIAYEMRGIGRDDRPVVKNET